MMLELQMANIIVYHSIGHSHSQAIGGSGQCILSEVTHRYTGIESKRTITS